MSFVRPIDRNLSGTTTLGYCGPGSNSNEGVLYIPQNSSIIGASPLDLGHLMGGVLPLCGEPVDVFYSPSWQGQWK